MSLFYQSKGSGTPVVLLHGFCETHEIWGDILEPLSTHYRVIAIDLPGFGKSALPTTPFSIDDIAVIVSDFLQELKAENPIVIGHSLGGYVTLAMAAQNPDLYAGIGLFHSTAYPDPEERKANRDKTIEFVKRNGVAPFVETYVPGLFSNKQNDAIGEVKRIALTTPQDTLIAYSLAMRDRPTRVDFLKSYHKPLLLLAGDNDAFIPLAALKEQSQLAQQATLHIISKAGHMGMLENVTDSLKYIDEFIRMNRLSRV